MLGGRDPMLTLQAQPKVAAKKGKALAPRQKAASAAGGAAPKRPTRRRAAVEESDEGSENSVLVGVLLGADMRAGARVLGRGRSCAGEARCRR